MYVNTDIHILCVCLWMDKNVKKRTNTIKLLQNSRIPVCFYLLYNSNPVESTKTKYTLLCVSPFLLQLLISATSSLQSLTYLRYNDHLQ